MQGETEGDNVPEKKKSVASVTKSQPELRLYHCGSCKSSTLQRKDMAVITSKTTGLCDRCYDKSNYKIPKGYWTE